MGGVSSLNISFDGFANGGDCPNSHYRSIQTDDKKIEKQILKDVMKLLEKYEKKGCHIGR